MSMKITTIMRVLLSERQGTMQAIPRILLFSGLLCYCTQALGQAESAEGDSKPKAIPLHGAHPQKIVTPDEYMLGANYFMGNKRGSSVLVLHDCAHDSSSYSSLGTKLAENKLNALALDFRGYGKSSSALFSHQMIKKNAKDIVAYQNEAAALKAYWDTDTLTAFNYLRKKVDNKKGISVVAVGCAAGFAVALAEKVRITAMVFITPDMSYGDKERYKNLLDTPTYFINSSHHIETYNTSKELFDWSGSKQSKMQVFKNDDYDYALLRKNHYLLDDISAWLSEIRN